MIDHTGFNVSDIARSKAFYTALLAPLGYVVMKEFTKEQTGRAHVVGLGVPPKPDFWLAEGPVNEPRIHLAFAASSQEQVHAFYEAGLQAGGTDNGAPGPRPIYHPGYYGAFLLDPDGHNVEACFHGAE